MSVVFFFFTSQDVNSIEGHSVLLMQKADIYFIKGIMCNYLCNGRDRFNQKVFYCYHCHSQMLNPPQKV